MSHRLIYTFHKLLREGVRERARKRVEIQRVGAKVKPRLGLCSIEVRGMVLIHNLSYNLFFYLIS